ncbi:7712_t:CDS:1 [Funneliformis mosseae]|uniref:7712_t:CDS:1 n=1 Tax=Funneliformis mosseae TaxID=27381 RepID=A0A9N8W5J1_FUNMO|nr:7712_t:CDS:1 [Funneliformis mosseae]
MDEETRNKYCNLLMFDMFPKSHVPNHDRFKDESNSLMPLMIDCTSSLENSKIKKDNFVFTSFVEPVKINQTRTKPMKNQKTSISTSISNEIIFNNITMTQCEPVEECADDMVVIDETTRKIEAKRPPRPPNAFILYRKAKQPTIVKERGQISNNEISKILATLWKNEPEEIRLHWRKIADRKKMEHMQAHPGYIYQPKKKADLNKKSRKRRTAVPKRESSLTSQNDLIESSASNVNWEHMTLPNEYVISPQTVSWSYDESPSHYPIQITSQFPNIPTLSDYYTQPQEMIYDLGGGYNVQYSQLEPNCLISANDSLFANPTWESTTQHSDGTDPYFYYFNPQIIPEEPQP